MKTISIEDRINAIKPGSSSYNYYINTPLNELKSRDEKLIKLELEKQYLHVLNESDVDDIDVGAGESGGVAVGAPLTFLDHFNEWVSGLFKSTKETETKTVNTKEDEDNVNIDNNRSFYGKAYDYVKDAYNTSADYLSNAYQYSASTLSSTFTNISSWVNSKINYYTANQTTGQDGGKDTQQNKPITYEEWEKNYSGKVTDPDMKHSMYDLYIKRTTGQFPPQDRPKPISYEEWEKNYFGGVEDPEMKKDLYDYYVKQTYGQDSGQGDQGGQNETIPQTSLTSDIITGTIIGAIIIIGIYAIWKIYKWFVRDDGNKKDATEATSEARFISNQLEEDCVSGKYIQIGECGNPFSSKFNPLYNNMAMAIIHESSNEAEEVVKSSTGSKGFMINCAIKFSNSLLNEDQKFINYMNKTKPEIVIDIQEWKDNAENSTEATQESKYYSSPIYNGMILNESDTDDSLDGKEKEDSIFDSILNKFKAGGRAIGSSIGYIRDKIKNLENKLESSDNKLIRWIPRTVKVALGALAIAAIFYGSKKAYDSFAPMGDEGLDQKANPGDTNSDPNNPISYEEWEKNYSGKVTDPDMKHSMYDLYIKRTTGQFPPQDRPKPITYEEWEKNYFGGVEDPEMKKDLYDYYVKQTYGQDSSRPNNISESTNINYMYINKYLNSLAIITEIIDKSKTSIDKERILDGLSGKGEELNSHIIERAKSVSMDLLNDKEFITFARKNIPDGLKLVEEASKTVKRK